MRHIKFFFLFCASFAGHICADTMKAHYQDEQSAIHGGKPANVDWKRCAEAALVSAAVAMKVWHTWDVNKKYYLTMDKKERE